jgi:hypothetical protein
VRPLAAIDGRGTCGWHSTRVTDGSASSRLPDGWPGARRVTRSRPPKVCTGSRDAGGIRGACGRSRAGVSRWTPASPLDAARGVAREAFGPDVDVVVESSCGPNQRCQAGETVDIAAVPADGRGSPMSAPSRSVTAADVRGPRDRRGPAAGFQVLALVGRPSLPLPTSATPRATPAGLPGSRARSTDRPGTSGLPGSHLRRQVAVRFTARFAPDSSSCRRTVGSSHARATGWS